MAASGCEGKFIQAFCAVFHSSKVHVHKTLAVISHVFSSSSSSRDRVAALSCFDRLSFDSSVSFELNFVYFHPCVAFPSSGSGLIEDEKFDFDIPVSPNDCGER